MPLREILHAWHPPRKSLYVMGESLYGGIFICKENSFRQANALVFQKYNFLLY